MLSGLSLLLHSLKLIGQLGDLGREGFDAIESLLLRGLPFIIAFQCSHRRFQAPDLVLSRLQHLPRGLLLCSILGFQRFNDSLLVDDLGLEVANTFPFLIELPLKGLDFPLEFLGNGTELP